MIKYYLMKWDQRSQLEHDANYAKVVASAPIWAIHLRVGFDCSVGLIPFNSIYSVISELQKKFPLFITWIKILYTLKDDSH